MKKFIFSFILFVFLSGQKLNAVVPGSLRVGLESAFLNLSSVSISNKNISVGYSGNFSAAQLSASGNFTASPADSYYIRSEIYYPDYISAKANANTYISSGLAACVVIFENNTFAVYIGGYSSQAAASADLQQVLGQSSIIPPNNRRVAIRDSGQAVLIFENTSSFGGISGSPHVELGSTRYRGAIEFARNSGGNITAVNVLSMEEYMFGAVPSEMPGTWNLEALKAMAVACRSYAVTRMGVHSGSGYDLCDRSHCQAYKGAGNETDNSNIAVMQTSGLMAYYGGTVINAVFHSSSGGETANSETVWNDALPYLRGVSDPFDTTGKVWQRSFTINEITNLLSGNRINIGSATGIKIGKASPNGRVEELVITGTNGSHTLYKEDIRTFFSSSAMGSLDSRLFSFSGKTVNMESPVNTALSIQGSGNTVTSQFSGLFAISEAARNPAQINAEITVVGNGASATYQNTQNSLSGSSGGISMQGDKIVISGKGFGHGVGLSQHGANGMAAAGYSYDKILKHYYTGIEIR